MKIVIGLVGEKGSGKETLARFLKQAAAGKTVGHKRFSDVLTETLRLWDIRATRKNLQKLAVVMDNAFGEGALTHAVYALIAREEADIVVLDGIRWKTDLAMLRRFTRNILVYVTADIETRYERVKERKEKEGEECATLEEFLEEEQAPNELLIPQIGREADVRIINNSRVDDFKKQIEGFHLEYVKTACE